MLGVHAIEELASELVHIGLMAMTAGCNATVFSDLSFNVPTLGALYQDAALAPDQRVERLANLWPARGDSSLPTTAQHNGLTQSRFRTECRLLRPKICRRVGEALTIR